MGTCSTVVFVARFQLIIVGSQRLNVGHRELFCVGRHQLIMNQKQKKPERATHFLADFLPSSHDSSGQT